MHIRFRAIWGLRLAEINFVDVLVTAEPAPEVMPWPVCYNLSDNDIDAVYYRGQ
jgi:hypothetical protein